METRKHCPTTCFVLDMTLVEEGVGVTVDMLQVDCMTQAICGWADQAVYT
jgi:hypothetical protein